MIDEAIEQGGDVLVWQWRIAQSKRTLDHHARALTDKMGQVIIGDGVEIADRDRVVQAFDEIGCRVDQGSVEVEDDGRCGQDEAPLRSDQCRRG